MVVLMMMVVVCVVEVVAVRAVDLVDGRFFGTGALLRLGYILNAISKLDRRENVNEIPFDDDSEVVDSAAIRCWRSDEAMYNTSKSQAKVVVIDERNDRKYCTGEQSPINDNVQESQRGVVTSKNNSMK